MMNENTKIDILLATYNGSNYLEELLASLVTQTWGNWNLLVRDDCSTDDTVAIINRFRSQYPHKVRLVDDGKGNLGPAKNFLELLKHSEARYIMFCDQDDIWLPQKIERTLQKIGEMENQYGSDVPLMVYTDMKVVDSSTQILASSFWRDQTLHPEIGKSLNRLLLNNVVIGCTMMFNKALRDISRQPPGQLLMHDWWLALVAVAAGRTDYLREPSVLYRQHRQNVVGATMNMGIGRILRECKEFTARKKEHRLFLLKTQRQAADLVARYKTMMSDKNIEIASAYASLEGQSFVRRRLTLIKYKLWGAGFIRSIVLWFLI